MCHKRFRFLAGVVLGLATLFAPHAAADEAAFGLRGGFYTEAEDAANSLAGVGVRTGSLIPYFQAKLIAKDDTEFVLAFGVRF